MAKVLVIDDDPAVRGVICGVLKLGGHEAEEAENGREGIEAMSRTRFALVICDLLMPVQGGMQTIQQIRERDARIPIIAISGALGDDEHRPLEHARGLGADASVSKPFTVEGLLAAVDDVLDRGFA